jgi:hypothetical protein
MSGMDAGGNGSAGTEPATDISSRADLLHEARRSGAAEVDPVR